MVCKGQYERLSFTFRRQPLFTPFGSNYFWRAWLSWSRSSVFNSVLFLYSLTFFVGFIVCFVWSFLNSSVWFSDELFCSLCTYSFLISLSRKKRKKKKKKVLFFPRNGGHYNFIFPSSQQRFSVSPCLFKLRFLDFLFSHCCCFSFVIGNFFNFFFPNRRLCFAFYNFPFLHNLLLVAVEYFLIFSPSPITSFSFGALSCCFSFCLLSKIWEKND